MSKVTILSRPNRIVIASKGVQGARGPEGPQGEQGLPGPKGDTGDVTPEAIAARDAAQEAASTASTAAGTATGAANAASGSASAAAASANLAEQARLLGATIGFATKADMDASLAHPAGTLALVTSDATAANNGTYRKTGASGSGSWVQSADRVTGLEAKISGVTDTLSAVVQGFGYSGTIPNGTAAASAGTYAFDVPLARSGNRVRFSFYARVAGTVYVQAVSRSGDVNTVVHEVAVSALAGYNVATVLLPHTAGQFFGIRCGSNIIAISTAPSSFLYWQVASQVTQGNSYTDATTAGANTVFHLRYELVPLLASGENVRELGDDLRQIANTIGGDGDENVWIGGPQGAPPVDGTHVGPSTYVSATPAHRDLQAIRLRAFVKSPGSIKLRAYTRAGNVFTKYGDDATVEFADVGAVDVVVPNFVLKAGQYYGIVGAQWIIAVSSDAISDGYFVGAGDAVEFTSSTPIKTYTVQLSVEFEPWSILNRVARLETEDDGAAAIRTPDSFIVVWGLGESHMSGPSGGEPSSVILPAGAAYKYTRSTGSIDHLADPTGNTVGASGSFGPALADSVWRMSNGTLGVILVNSGLGSSTIGNQWAAGGSAWTQAMADWADAMTKIAAAGLPVAGVCVCLNIGSNDAAAGTLKAAFKAGVMDLYGRCQTIVGAGPSLPVVLAQTGDFRDGSHASAVQVIRDAQNELVAENDEIHMGWTGAKTFVERGLMRDNVHYRQLGLDIWGRSIGAHVIAKGTGLYPMALE